MKKIKLFSLLTALLLAVSTMAAATSYIPQGVKEVTENTIVYAAGVPLGSNYNPASDWMGCPTTNSISSAQTYTNVTENTDGGNPKELTDNIANAEKVTMYKLSTSTNNYNKNGKVIHMHVKGISEIIVHGLTTSDGRGMAIGYNEVTTELNESSAISEFASVQYASGKKGSFIVNLPKLDATQEYVISIWAVGGDAYFYAAELITGVKVPTLTSFTINEVEAVIDDEAKTITAVLPYGTTIDWKSVAVVLGGTATQWSINEEHTQLTIGNAEGTQIVYTLNITVAEPSQDATLSAITVGGEALEGFTPAQLTYGIELAYGTTLIPTVAATTTDEKATYTVTYVDAEGEETTNLPCIATIEVTAEDGSTKQTYTIEFTIATCKNPELALSAESIAAIFETEDLVAPVLSNPHNLSVVYATSNKEVVTVDQTGALTKVGVGEAIITITAAKQTVEGVEYCEDELSYKVTLTAHPITGSTTIFKWETVASTPTIPNADNVNLNATGYGTLTIGMSIVYRQFWTKAIEASKGYYKMGTDSIAFECAVEGGFLAGDEITIVGKNGGGGDRNFMIGNGSATAGTTEGNIASSTQSTQTDNSTYTALMDETNAEGVLRVFRLTGKTMYLKSIQVVRPCTVESGLLLDKTTVEVTVSETTIAAPELTNPHNLVVKYESSDAEIVAVDANTGVLTKGTKTGTATITISWERQTIDFVRYCADELAYTVTVKGGATEISNAEVYAPAQKVIRDGQLLIIRDGKTYTAQGVQVQ